MRHIPHLYIPRPWEEGSIRADAAQVDHLERVLRIGHKASVTYTDGLGSFGTGTWAGGAVDRGDERLRPRPNVLIMAVAPPTSRDRARFVVEKLAELGVEALLWLRTSNGGRRVPSDGKLASWAVSALEQSRGSWLMRVGSSLAEWADLERPIAVCVPGAPGPEPDARARTVAIGPEGGFEPDEIPSSATRVGLGETILRIETAAVVAAANFR